MKYKLKNRICQETFKQINSPEKAYFLGLLWADGSLDKNSICIELKESDMKDLLLMFKKIGDFLISTRVRSNSFNKQCAVKIYSRKLSKFLQENYSYSKKSIVAPSYILSLIPEDLRRYWWRGFFDGDGSFSKNKTKRPNYFYYRMTIYSTFEQDWKEFKLLSDKLKFRFSLERKIRKTGHKYSLVNLGCKDSIKKFASYIYFNKYDGIGLKRKYNVYKDFLKNGAYIDLFRIPK
jgi:hypothetical protein